MIRIKVNFTTTTVSGLRFIFVLSAYTAIVTISYQKVTCLIHPVDSQNQMPSAHATSVELQMKYANGHRINSALCFCLLQFVQIMLIKCLHRNLKKVAQMGLTARLINILTCFNDQMKEFPRLLCA
jgi:hypothetical protein